MTPSSSLTHKTYVPSDHRQHWLPRCRITSLRMKALAPPTLPRAPSSDASQSIAITSSLEGSRVGARAGAAPALVLPFFADVEKSGGFGEQRGGA
jgi:hypothetical protein